jgi:hypothetical protein
VGAWSEVEAREPDLAARARAFLDAHRHLTVATLRVRGAPRISGTEVLFAEGQMWLGSMYGSMKARDLQRDPRFALHSASEDPPAWRGDATVSGVAEEVVDPNVRARVLGEHAETGSHLFRCDVREVSVVALGDPPDHITIDTWREGRGVLRVERR